jgi:Cu/Zn superoxide dismutase
MKPLSFALGVFLVAALAGCGDDDGTGSGTDAGGDAARADSGPMTGDGGVADAGPRDTGTESDAGDVADAGTDGGPPLPTAIATITEAEGDDDIMGTVTFVQSGADVTVTYTLTNCPEGTHPTHIHSGTGCGSRGEMGMHWDPPRGENIPDIECDASGSGTVTYTREGSMPALAWTIGDGAATDIVGLPVVIHGAEPDTDPRIGCGVITMP